MKRLLAIAIITCFAGSLYAGDIIIVPKIGVDNAGTLKSSYSGGSANIDIDMGYSISVDVLKKINNKIKAGLGVEYQLGKNIPKSEYNTSGKHLELYFIPVYLTGQYSFAKESKFSPYIKLNLGYGMYDGNDTIKEQNTFGIGLYYALGIGAKLYDNIYGELLYSSYSGTREIKTRNIKYDDTLSLVGLKIGYKFKCDCAK